MKVSELSGAQLDYWVAKAAGMRVQMGDISCQVFMGQWTVEVDSEPVDTWAPFRPSMEWNQGGPIIERESIGLIRVTDGTWTAGLTYTAPWEANSWDGATPLQAAMRCYVASKFGEEVNE